MTLNTTYSPTVADGNGVTTSFSYSFNPISENYLKVSLEQNGSWVEQVSGWTATVSENGGVVTFDTAPTTRVAIERDVPEEQPTSYKTSSGFQAQVIEHSFDMLTGMVQELKEKSDRSIAVDVGSSVNPDDVVHQVERVYSSIDNIDDVAGDLTNIDTVAGDKANIDTVAGDKANIDAIAPNISKVNSVANSMSAVNTVATNVAAVNTVSTIRNQVITVAVNSAAINAVNNNKKNIDIVANNKSDVNTVASNMSSVVNVGYNINHISRVEANKDNIDAVADDISNVNRVGGSISNVNAVAAGLSDISDVLDNMTNIDTVAGSITNVNRVGGSISNVNDVAAGLSDISDVLDNMTNIDTVAGSITNVNLVGADISKVAGVADDLTNIDAVNANKTNIDKVASIKNDVTTVAGIQGDVMAVAADATIITAVHGDLSNIDAVATDKVNVDSVANNINSVNVVADKITNVNTVATNIGAVNTAANNINAINDAPTYAAQAKQWAIGVPGEPSGGSAKYWAERAEDAASGMENPANRDLSNLTATGQMIIDSQNGTISNCVLEIPQNIKCELSGKNLTVKAGSILTFTGQTYKTKTLTVDYIRTDFTLSQGRYMFFFSSVGTYFSWANMRKLDSGGELPTDNTNYEWYFLTSDKMIYRWLNNQWTIQDLTYPICVIDVDSDGNLSFAKDSNGNDMIFNGAGFIGHHAFVYPNVKALLPNGFNDDGSLKSISATTNSLQIIEFTSASAIFIKNNLTLSNDTGYYEVESYEDIGTVWSAIYYVRKENAMYLHQSSNIGGYVRSFLIGYTYNGTTVTDFTIRQPVRMATTENSYTKEQVDTKLAGKQNTLVSGTNIKTINSTNVLGSGNFALADQSLSNLDSNGQMIVDSQNGTISNCVLEIPQNLKLEISGGVVTLKAGSIVTNSGSTYQTITATQDITSSALPSVDGRYLIFARPSDLAMSVFATEYCFSGTTHGVPEGTAHIWFDTNSKEVRQYFINGSYGVRSYPVCLVEVSNGVASFAKDSNGNDMIFNGAGFVGHHAFVYPNVKRLQANGVNEDGSLKSSIGINSALKIYEIGTSTIIGLGGNNQLSIYYVESETEPATNYTLWYKPSENLLYRKSGTGIVTLNGSTMFIQSAYNGSIVTDFTIRQPYQGARNLLTDDVDEHVKQNTTDISTKQADLTTVSGYDATTTQVLKHVNGVLTWVTEE